MICTVHQPNFFPYLGFFQKFKNSDIFVLYDHAQYTKNDFHNRNKIKIEGKAQWLTIPVNVHLGQKINEIDFCDLDFVEKHLRTIKSSYSRAPFFDQIFPDIENLYKDIVSLKLVDFNTKTLKMIFSKFDDSKKIVLSSELDLDFTQKSTSVLIDICKAVSADSYLSGVGAKEYLDMSIFTKNSINLNWQNFQHPAYKQLGENFLPNLSVLDALFNLGYQETYNIL